MSNPLEKFFKVEERADGVYIQVGRKEKKPSVEEVCSVLNEAGVINVNEEMLRDVITRARGAFERIGPSFEYYDPNIESYLSAEVTPETAVLTVNSNLFSEYKLDEKLLAFYLSRKGVRSGLQREKLRKIIAEKLYDRPQVVAEARAAIAGADAKIEFKVNIDEQLSPEVRSNGSVDYRNVHAFTSVSAGQVLAQKIPPTEGVAGVSVTGEQIPAQPGEDRPLPGGRNTEISSDGLKLVSTRDGVVKLEDGHVNVKEILTVPGDVDFSTGNIKFSGDVEVDGNVLPGFSVETEGDIHIKGEVESARIVSRNGAVRIDKGVIGREDTLISAKTEIHLSFAQEAFLRTEGTLVFDKFLIHCDSICREMESAGSKGSVMGGIVKAEKSVKVHELGRENEVKTSVVLFDKIKEKQKEKLKELLTLEERFVKEMEKVERQLKTKAAILKKAGDVVTDRHRSEVKKWMQFYGAMKEKAAYIRKNKEEVEKTIAGPPSIEGFIQVSGTVFPGVKINMYGTPLIQKLPLNNVVLRSSDNRPEKE
ncbi:MAG: DUF342 domain-containing protein [Chitinispirillaceae bacterium]